MGPERVSGVAWMSMVATLEGRLLLGVRAMKLDFEDALHFQMLETVFVFHRISPCSRWTTNVGYSDCRCPPVFFSPATDVSQQEVIPHIMRLISTGLMLVLIKRFVLVYHGHYEILISVSAHVCVSQYLK